MEYRKTGEKFSFGIGTVSTAGIGKLSDGKKITGRCSAKTIAERAVTAGIQAMAVTGVIILKCHINNRRNKT
ncbi:MAG: hypothetical protein K2H28_04555 [Ruminococcus sp.]|nr:hypothetical protein [Ruminococcus sp.]